MRGRQSSFADRLEDGVRVPSSVDSVLLRAGITALVTFALGCGVAEDGSPGSATGRTGGSAGAAAGGDSSGGAPGTGGLTTGAGGSSGVSGGGGGSGNAAGSGGGGSDGRGGASGSGGAAGSAGSSAGASGAAGNDGGTGGSAGMAGSAGAGGVSADGGGASGSAGSGGTDGGPGSSGCGKAGRTGAFQATITAAGLERGYYLSVPQTYDPMVRQRLVFGYHGSNYTGMRMRTYLTLEQAPLLNGTIFVYPDGLPLPNEPDHVAWVLTADGRDLAFFDELYAKLSAEYCIDTERVFVNGQSFGGLMTNAVGCLRGNVVRAIAVVAGSGPRSSTCQGQVAAWLTHGMDDTSVTFSSGETSRNFWIAANHCTTTTMIGDPPQCLNYQGCDSGHPVIWCPHVNDGGHQHPSFGRAAVRAFLAGF